MPSQPTQHSTYETLPTDDKILLKAVKASEAGALFELVDFNRDYLAEYLPWARGNTREDSATFVQKVQSDRMEGAEYGFGIYYDGVLAGHISLMHLADGKTPEIGYWLTKKLSGKGITKRAAERLSRFGFETLGLKEIVIKAATTNIASNKIAENIGYQLYTTEKSDNGTKINVWRKTP